MSKSKKRVKGVTMGQSIKYLKEKTYKGKPTKFAGGINLNVHSKKKKRGEK